MKLAKSGSRGVFWRPSPRGSQEFTLADGRRPVKDDPKRGQRGDWWIRWTCPHGHLHRKPVGPKSLAQDQSQRHRLDRPCPDREVKPTAYLLSDIIDEYLTQARAHKRSYRDDARYGAAWKARFSGKLIDDIGPADLERVKADRLSAVKPSTVNRELAFLKHLYNLAIRDGRTERNPVGRIRLLKEPSGRVRYLTDDEETRLLQALCTENARQRVQFLIHTGLRKAEFTHLRWKDLDLRQGIITIPRSKNGETRHVPMTSAVKTLLNRLPRTLDASAFVFPSSDGTPHSHWVEKAFPEAVRAAGIEDFRFHDLRHTFASRLAMAGVDLLSIKELGGWKSLTMVQRYAHLSPSHRREAIERLVTRRIETHASASAVAVAP
jgi:integrase